MIKKKTQKILVIGSTVCDLVAKTDKLPIPGQTILGDKFFMAPGGKGANQAASIAKLNGDVTFISKTGMDFYGDYVIKHIKESGVDTSNIIRDKSTHSGVSLICLLNEGENAILMNPGANMKITIPEIERLENLFEKSSILLIQLEIPIEVVEKSLTLAKKHKCLTILDPAPALDMPDKIFSLADIITPNENELETFSGISTSSSEDIYKASCKMLDRGVSTVICTKSDGAYLTTREKKATYFPGIKVEASDTTGAGDSFAGALAYRLVLGEKIDKAIVYANVTAGLSVTKLGAMPSFPSKDEVTGFMHEEF